MKKIVFHKIISFCLLLLAVKEMQAQRPIPRDPGRPAPGQPPAPLPGGREGTIGGGGGQRDSLKKRDLSADTLTVTFKYVDSTVANRFDTTINEFYKRFPASPYHHHLGNLGTATFPIIYAPAQTAGFDAGFHALDMYKWKLEDVRFFTSTRPYTELSYTLGSQTQQIIEVMHTQNIRPHWNAAFKYRMINSPGFFKNQRTNHNNYLLNSWYESPNRRYNNYFVLLGNALQTEENGGILRDRDYLNDPIYERRFSIPVHLGNDIAFGRNFFETNFAIGNRYTDFKAFMRQQYDLGRKDSIVLDTIVIPLFFPRLRFEHTVSYSSNRYRFKDISDFRSGHTYDSIYYHTFYNRAVPDSFTVADRWRDFSNDFSIYIFPDSRNQHQFIKAGVNVQLLQGEFEENSVAPFSSASLYNIIGHGEYRNRTKNQRWNILAKGQVWFNGYNEGDYHAFVSLQGASAKLGSLQLGFENINRSPSFIYDTRSSFYFDQPKSFAKENIIHLFATAHQPKLNLQLKANHYLINNFLYLRNFYELEQYTNPFSVLVISALKSFRLSKHFNLYSEVYLQQKAGGAPLNLPLFFTRNRIAFEGHFFKNLHLSTGLEVRYHTPYRVNEYSPVLGQFFFQDVDRINNFPDVSAFFNFRIRTFKAFVRADHLNTLNFADFSFTNNNMAAPGYPYPGLVTRLGIYWSFVN